MSVGRSWFPAARIGSRASAVCAMAGVVAAVFMMVTIAGCGGGGGPKFINQPPPPLTSAIVVANSGAVASIGSSVTSYTATAGKLSSSNAAPNTELTGASTLIFGPGGAILNAIGETIATSGAVPAVLEFAPGANGDSGPVGLIACLAPFDCAVPNTVPPTPPTNCGGVGQPVCDVTGISSPFGISVPALASEATAGDFIVANTDTAHAGAKPFGNVELFPPINPVAPGFPNTAPTAIIEPLATPVAPLCKDVLGHDLMFGPADAVEASALLPSPLTSSVWVSNFFGNFIAAYPAFSTGTGGPPAVVEACPVALIAGPATLLDKPEYIAFDPTNPGMLYVANSGSNSVTVYDIADITAANGGDIAPRAILSGLNAGLNIPIGLALHEVPSGDAAVAPSGPEVFVASSGANAGNGAIQEFAPLNISEVAGTTTQNNPFPIGQLVGSATQLNLPSGIFLVLPPAP